MDFDKFTNVLEGGVQVIVGSAMIGAALMETTSTEGVEIEDEVLDERLEDFEIDHINSDIATMFEIAENAMAVWGVNGKIETLEKLAAIAGDEKGTADLWADEEHEVKVIWENYLDKTTKIEVENGNLGNDGKGRVSLSVEMEGLRDENISMRISAFRCEERGRELAEDLVESGIATDWEERSSQSSQTTFFRINLAKNPTVSESEEEKVEA